MHAISLTKLLEDRPFKDDFDKHIVFPVKRANAALLVPATSNAGIDFGAVGVAYEYCLRCAIHRMSKADHTAIQSFPAFKYYYLRYEGNIRARKQMDTHLHSLKQYLDCKLNNANDLFMACLFLAKFDAEYKSGMPIEDFSVHQKNLNELARIVAGSNLGWLEGKSTVTGPLFDCDGNDSAIRADGDLIADKTLIDIKTSSRLALKDSFRQLVGYYALNNIAGGHFQIDSLGLYYPRFNYFVECPICNILPEGNVESLLSLFKKKLGSNIKRDESRNYDFVDGRVQNEITLTDNKGLTLLHHAAFKGDHEMIASLIKKGANLNARDNEGHPPLFYAILKKYTDISEILIKAGANVNLTDNEGWTPLLYAIFKECADIAEMLIKAGADVNLTKNASEFPLLLAVSVHNQTLIQIVLNAGANVNCQDDEGWTPLHVAVSEKQVDTIRLLIAHGADVEVKDRDGLTPLGIAPKKQKKEMLDLLGTANVPS